MFEKKMANLKKKKIEKKRKNRRLVGFCNKYLLDL